MKPTSHLKHGEFIESFFVERPLPFCCPPQGLVMKNDRVTVFRQSDVGLNEVYAEVNRLPKRSEGVFGMGAGGTSVSDD